MEIHRAVHALRTIRDTEVRYRYDQLNEFAALARGYRLTKRWIYYIVGQDEPAEDRQENLL